MAKPSFDYAPYIRELPGKNRCDMTKLLATPEVLARALQDLTEPFRDKGVIKVAALDALGFALGGSVAHLLNAGLVLIRKGGKVAWHVQRVSFTEYSGEEQSLEVTQDAAGAGDSILIVDDWSETGSQLKATSSLLEGLQAHVLGAVLTNIKADVLQEPTLGGYTLHSLLRENP